MVFKGIQNKGILAKLLEKGIKIFLRSQCKKVDEINIDIIASSIQIIKGIIPKIYIIAENINYRDLLFDEIELKASEAKIFFKIKNKEIIFGNNLPIEFKISLSEKSLKSILLSKNWNWIWRMISKEILNQEELEDIIIRKDEILINSKNDTNIFNESEKIVIKAAKGNIYLENKYHTKSIKIPIEDKIYFKQISIENDSIILFANSSISFN